MYLKHYLQLAYTEVHLGWEGVLNIVQHIDVTLEPDGDKSHSAVPRVCLWTNTYLPFKLMTETLRLTLSLLGNLADLGST